MNKSLTIQVDPRNHTIYIYLRPIGAGGVARTEKLGRGVMADLGKNGELLGVELLGPKAVEHLFSLVPTEERFEPLRDLTSKKESLGRLIA